MCLMYLLFTLVFSYQNKYCSIKMSLQFNSKELTRECYVQCLSQQLSEIELLKSMYPNHGEIVLTDKYVLQAVEEFVNNQQEHLPAHLDFTINLHISDLKLEVCVTLPSCYPDDEPDIYLRCNQLNRLQESSLNSQLTEYIKSIQLGEVCLFSVITWLQDNIDSYKIHQTNSNELEDIKKIKTKEDSFVRMWIFSHHIYNKKKREEIVKKSKEYKVTGFCLPGKPGVICIEGEERACQDWWKDIKSLTWKKIMIRKTETLKLFEEEKKFSTFEEMTFASNANNNHSNMSEFSKYMQARGLTPIFNEFFGLSNI